MFNTKCVEYTQMNPCFNTRCVISHNYHVNYLQRHLEKNTIQRTINHVQITDYKTDNILINIFHYANIIRGE